jgi:hypothetical protein
MPISRKSKSIKKSRKTKRSNKTRKNMRKMKGGSEEGRNYFEICLPENGVTDQTIYYSSPDKTDDSLLGKCVNKNVRESVAFAIINDNNLQHKTNYLDMSNGNTRVYFFN